MVLCSIFAQHAKHYQTLVLQNTERASVESMLYFREYSRAKKLLCIGARHREDGKPLFIGAYITNLPFICPTSRRKEQKMNFDLPRKANILSILDPELLRKFGEMRLKVA